MTKLKNIVIKHNQYWFQKKWPKDVKNLIGKTSFTRKLNLNKSSTSEKELSRAKDAIEEQYNLQVKMYRNSNPDALTSLEIAKLVAYELSQRKLSAGQLSELDFDPDEFSNKHEAQINLADSFIPEAIHIEREIALWGKQESEMTTEEIVLLMAHSALLNRDIINPVTIESLWDDYYQYKGLQSRDKKDVLRLKTGWQTFSSFIGVNFLSATSYSTDIRPALNKYIEHLKDNRGVKIATVDRYLNNILAIINYGNEKHQFNWRVTKPKLPKYRNKDRAQYPTKEQITIVEGCLSQKGHKALVACSILLYLQGSMMPSEVSRLRAEDIYLEKEQPFLVINQETKTHSRKRVIPITVGLQFIKSNINELIEWLNKTSTDNCSRQMKIMLSEFVPHMPGQTAHCLRHSFRHNSVYANANQANTALIGGWSGPSVGLSERMLRYGMGDMYNSEFVQGLYKTSKLINKHLLNVGI